MTEIAVSSGAACLSAEPSHVLQALGLSRDRALASLRFAAGRRTTVDDIDRAAAHVGSVVSHLRATAPPTASGVAVPASTGTTTGSRSGLVAVRA
jgi:cysteine desulfurase